ncbi:MAG TPA: FAD-dependent oxidoreductase [Solirubrobacteraceae bacterium]
MSAGGVIVIGGGLAGITAALDCAAAGAEVTLLEVRRRLGGAAYSFHREGLEMDNGQHVFLRGCAAYRGLLARLGSDHLVEVQPRLEIPVLKPGARPYTLRRSSLPAPLQLAGALARYPHLTATQRLGAARAALALMRLGRSRSGRRELELDELTLGAWLARHGQGAEAIAALWDLIALPTLNIRAADASLALGEFVFRAGLLTDTAAGDVGFHRGTLSEVIARPAAAALAAAGVEVRLGWGAERVERTGAGFLVLARGARAEAEVARAGEAGGDGARGGEGEPRSPGERGGDGGRGGADDGLAADTVIVALPHMRAARLLEPLLGDAARRLQRLGVSPIVNLHVLYDRPVYSEPFAAGVGTPVQYLFDRSAAAGAPAGCQYLAVSLSGAEEEMGMSVERLRERYLPALAELLPRARAAKVESFLVTREHAATFRAAPGVQSLRPRAESGLGGLLLAGAWTATGWPATLEGAVLSGHAAAEGALRALGLRARPADHGVPLPAGAASGAARA